MVKNQIAVFIDGISYTNKLITPVKFGDLLDERLDECTLSLRNVKREYFAPMTPVEIVIRNEVYWGGYDKDKVHHREEDVKYFLVSDDAADESILGKHLFNHDLHLVEVTKAAELVIVDSITFTNELGKNYTEKGDLAEPIFNE